jgi:hypothetical protein
MIPTVNAGHFGSTALAVHEVDRLPDAAIPGVVTNAERPSQHIAGLDRVDAGLPDLGKVERLILASGVVVGSTGLVRTTWPVC